MEKVKLLILAFKTGIVAFGSGYVTIPFLYQNLVPTKIIPEQTFTYLLATSQMSPGPLAINLLSLLSLQLTHPLMAVLNLLTFLSFPFFAIIIFKLLWNKLTPSYQKKIGLLMLPLVSTFLLWALVSLKFPTLLKNNLYFYLCFSLVFFFSKIPLPYIMIGAGTWQLLKYFF